ncbi:conserved Plasmodium protein, unknown function [Plasmodium ovale curtisi]|uniref:Uncharacterized protein n=1 Tax=Plasmodium ovale curtisi TaxID=864141 RepID=A0A1A8VPJ0_PLAOA|nr:conserved Plasmodium protein, unknown function [Plasmodium ovale curtisi]SBT02093.1 conserved Plasmodium protein, unknown function [Plasmodium ovale curtisi]
MELEINENANPCNNLKNEKENVEGKNDGLLFDTRKEENGNSPYHDISPERHFVKDHFTPLSKQLGPFARPLLNGEMGNYNASGDFAPLWKEEIVTSSIKKNKNAFAGHIALEAVAKASKFISKNERIQKEYSGVGLNNEKSFDEGDNKHMDSQGVHFIDKVENVTEIQPKKKFLLGAKPVLPGIDKELLEKLKSRKVTNDDNDSLQKGKKVFNPAVESLKKKDEKGIKIAHNECIFSHFSRTLLILSFNHVSSNICKTVIYGTLTPL